MTARIRGMLASAGVVLALGSSSVIAENIKIAFIDPLSGPFAPVGQNTFHSFQLAAEIANKEK